LNKTEKLIVAFLLANIALAGALHFFSPIRPAVSIEKSELAKSPANKADSYASVVSTPVVFTSDTPSDYSLDQFRQWARKDPSAAWDWTLKQPDGDRRVEMLEELCCEIAEDGDPARAVALADTLRLTSHGALASLEQQWAQKDLSAARAWAITKPAGDEKNELLERVAYVWASADPENAARFVVENMPTGNAQTEAVMSVLHQWALRDFAGAEAWVELFPAGELRQRATNELAGIREYSLADGASGSFLSESSRTP
jgi:hypothetical protein